MIYLIGGVPRAGKTNLSKRLVKALKIKCISFDDITLLFETFAPEYGLFNIMDPDLSEIKALPIVLKLIERYTGYANDSLIIEGDNFNLDYWEKYKMSSKGNIKMAILGYENITPKEKIRLNKENSTAKNCWFEQIDSFDRKIEIAEYMINKSKLYKHQVIKTSEPSKLQYFNTHDNYDKSINECLEFLLDTK